MRCRIGKRDVTVTVKGRGDAELEIWAARNKAGLFEDVFGRSISFEYSA